MQAQIHQQLLNLRRVGLKRIERGVNYFEFDIFADDLVQKAGQVARYRVQVHAPGLEYLAARKSEQFTRQCRGPLGLLPDAREAFRDLRIAPGLIKPQFGPPQNRADDIVEVMSDAAGKLPDGFELL